MQPNAYLITGISGSGKTTLARHFKKAGHSAIDGDASFGYHPEVADQPGTSVEKQWFYNQEKLEQLLLTPSPTPVFIFGNGDNEHDYLHLFKAVFCLHASSKVIVERLASPLREHGYGWEEHHRQETLERMGPYYTQMEAAGVTFINAEQTPDEITREILGKVAR